MNLTSSQLDVLAGAARGESVAETATRRFTSPETVRSHRKQIMGEMRTNSMTHSVAIALVSGMLSPDVVFGTAPVLRPREREAVLVSLADRRLHLVAPPE